jgi:hypothetical protein
MTEEGDVREASADIVSRIRCFAGAFDLSEISRHGIALPSGYGIMIREATSCCNAAFSVVLSDCLRQPDFWALFSVIQRCIAEVLLRN